MSAASQPDADGPVVLAVDIGGTKLAVGVVGPEGEVLVEDRAATVGEGPEGLFGTLTTLIDGVLDRSDEVPDVIGVGCGGPMERHGETVSPLNIAQWRAFPLGARLADRYGSAAFVDNDAKALALGEGWVGAARGHSDYMALVVSTGVGGGIITDGRLLDGDSGNAGHLGHVIVDPLGRPCRCGARGCLEAEASGTAIREITGRPAAEADTATRIRTGRLVGRAVASVANLLDLRLAVVAGSVALGFGKPFFEAANLELERCARLEFSRGGRLVPAGCGGNGPLVGAAAVGRRGVGAPVLRGSAGVPG
jgi:glucokinase